MYTYAHTFALLDSNLETMKNASGKRPPDEAHGPGKEAIRSAFKNSATFRQTFFAFSQFYYQNFSDFYLIIFSKSNCCLKFMN